MPRERLHGINSSGMTRAKRVTSLHLSAGSRRDAHLIKVLADKLRILSADFTAEEARL